MHSVKEATACCRGGRSAPAQLLSKTRATHTSELVEVQNNCDVQVHYVGAKMAATVVAVDASRMGKKKCCLAHPAGGSFREQKAGSAIVQSPAAPLQEPPCNH